MHIIIERMTFRAFKKNQITLGLIEVTIFHNNKHNSCNCFVNYPCICIQYLVRFLIIPKFFSFITKIDGILIVQGFLKHYKLANKCSLHQGFQFLMGDVYIMTWLLPFILSFAQLSSPCNYFCREDRVAFRYLTS